MKTYKEMCDELPIQSGDLVRVLRGTKIKTTHPSKPLVCGKTHIVKVFRSYPGYYVDYEHKKNAEVCWVGSGSYWFYANMDDVEKV